MQIISKVILVVLFLIIGFIGLLYLTLRTKVNDVSKEEPFISYLNKDLVLSRDVLLVRNIDAFVFENPLLIVEKDEGLYEGISVETLLKAGTKLRLEEAKLFTNGTSGFTTSIVLGVVFTDSGQMAFETNWGYQNVTLSNDNPNYFTFSEPIWEAKELDTLKRYVF